MVMAKVRRRDNFESMVQLLQLRTLRKKVDPIMSISHTPFGQAAEALERKVANHPSNVLVLFLLRAERRDCDSAHK
jgi:hypothetical protein